MVIGHLPADCGGRDYPVRIAHSTKVLLNLSSCWSEGMTVSPSYRAAAMGLARRAGVESNRLVWPTEGDLFEGTFSRTLAKPGSSTL